MKISKIASASVITKINSILAEDIDVLSNMLASRTCESRSHKLIHSLIEAKRKIIAVLPEMRLEEGQIPTTGQKNSLTGYRSKELVDYGDEQLLNKIFLEIEEDQFDFVKNTARAEGLPSAIDSMLNEILGIYMSIIEQLGRAKKSNQINEIVV